MRGQHAARIEQPAGTSEARAQGRGSWLAVDSPPVVPRGVGGWADEAAVRTALGMDGECDGQQDKVIGWFHVGASDKAASYRARRGAVEEKVTWIE